MKILVMCSDTGVRIGDTKGAALHLRAIAHAFAALGHEVEAVGVAASGVQPQGKWQTPVHLVPHPGRSSGVERERRKLAIVGAVRTMAQEVANRSEPDVVYERLSLFGGAGHEVAHASGACHVLEVNALLAEEETAYRSLFQVGLAQRIESSILAAADLRIAVSDEIALAVRAHAPDRPTLVVPNGADTDLFAARPDRMLARQSLSLPAGTPLLVFTGTLRPWHGVELAISALEALPDEVRLVIAGDGDLKAGLVRHAGRLGVAHRVHWLGQVPHDRIPALLAAGDLALAPYPQLPGFAFSPLKLYEYLAAGIPVIASDIGQISRLLEDGRYGRLVEPGNVHALAAAIRSELSDPAAGQHRAGHARDFSLSAHSWTNRAQRILDKVAELPARGRHATEGWHALAR